jgi:hypothetical protein
VLVARGKELMRGCTVGIFFMPDSNTKIKDLQHSVELVLKSVGREMFLLRATSSIKDRRLE